MPDGNGDYGYVQVQGALTPKLKPQNSQKRHDNDPQTTKDGEETSQIATRNGTESASPRDETTTSNNQDNHQVSPALNNTRVDSNNDVHQGDKGTTNESHQEEQDPGCYFWSSVTTLREVLMERLGTPQSAIEELGLPFCVRDVVVLDASQSSSSSSISTATNPLFTKFRVVYESPSQAHAVVAHCQASLLSPVHLLAPVLAAAAAAVGAMDTTGFQFSSKPLQWTHCTCQPLVQPSWPRSSPPKFRRLLLQPHTLEDNDDDDNEEDRLRQLQHERETTRFVFVTNLLPAAQPSPAVDRPLHTEVTPTSSTTTASTVSTWNGNVTQARNALRSIFSQYDTSGQGVEVFVAASKSKLDQYCHVGMRSADDAQRLIQALQDQVVTWQWNAATNTTNTRTADTNHNQWWTAQSGRLFLDYATATIPPRVERRRQQRSRLQNNTTVNGIDQNPSTTSTSAAGVAGEPTRPECTSQTRHVVVPGLQLIPNFVSAQEEASLMAVLMGPQAPWAPSQSTPTEGGIVKRRVQHYGYVFDYQTAHVLRDRTQPQAQCPPLPVIAALSQSESDVDNNDDNNNNTREQMKEAKELASSHTDQSHQTTSSNLVRVEEQIQQAIAQGRGWNVLAGVLERTRCTKFDATPVPTSSSSSQDETVMPNHEPENDKEASLSFPNLNQVTVNHYAPGEGIGSHVDTPSAFGDGLLSCSLNSGIVMEFRKVESKDNHNNSSGDQTKSRRPVKRLVYLPPRSLLILTGPARYEWEHQIVTRRTDCVDTKILKRGVRVSLTFRTALNVDGSPLPRVTSSIFPPQWQHPPPVNNNKKNLDDKDRLELQQQQQQQGLVTPDCERDHVHAVYDAIATQWHHTRGRRGVLWPGATQFLQQLPPGSMVADIGCGDGKYFPAIWEAGSYVIGIDMSRPLLQTCFASHNPWGASSSNCSEPAKDGTETKHAQLSTAPIPDSRRISPSRQSLSDHPAVAVGDCIHVPLRDESCDAAICIAVLHHISTKERRIRCLKELVRIVKPGALINVQAWSMEQETNSRRKFAAEDVFVPFNAQPKYLQLPTTDGSNGTSPTNVNEPNTNPPNSKASTARRYAEAHPHADYDEGKGLVVFQRYCHLYRKGELEDLIVHHIPTVDIVHGGFESGNYFVILQKKKKNQSQ